MAAVALLAPESSGVDPPIRLGPGKTGFTLLAAKPCDRTRPHDLSGLLPRGDNLLPSELRSFGAIGHQTLPVARMVEGLARKDDHLEYQTNQDPTTNRSPIGPETGSNNPQLTACWRVLE